MFLGGHRYVIDNCAIEFEQKKIDLDAYINGTPPSRLQRRKLYVVRIGNKSEQSHNKIEEQIGRDGRLITTPPSVSGIGIKTQSFGRIADPFIWNFLLEKDIDEEDKASVIGVFHITIIINDDNDDYLLVIIVPTSTCQQKEKVERRREQRGCVIKC